MTPLGKAKSKPTARHHSAKPKASRLHDTARQSQKQADCTAPLGKAESNPTARHHSAKPKASRLHDNNYRQMQKRQKIKQKNNETQETAGQNRRFLCFSNIISEKRRVFRYLVQD
ncbi:MAG: hypothetical protein J6Q85_01975 [Clostridia bacterium]|nr:hypothetical protein [Clostridia bacterium]